MKTIITRNNAEAILKVLTALEELTSKPLSADDADYGIGNVALTYCGHVVGFFSNPDGDYWVYEEEEV